MEIDYEKAYKEALERARKAYNAIKPENYGARKIIENAFPELRETKDERIRKEIIAILKKSYNVGGFTLNNKKDLDSYLAYLEKQKDASEAIEAVERIDRYITEHTANSWEMDDSNPDKKYYCGVDDTLSDIAGILQGVYAKQKESLHIEKTCKDNADSFTSEQKEKKQYDDDPLNDPRFLEGFDVGREVQKIFDEPKPAERSLEDDHIIGFVYDLLNEIEWKDNWAMSKEECLERLKSLCPRSSWKPSKEQMRVLSWAANGMVDKCIAAPEMRAVLRELYEQLKKL